MHSWKQGSSRTTPSGGDDWQAAYVAFRALDTLDAADHDALAETAHWLGRADEVLSESMEAYRLHLAADEPGAAALSAFMLAVYLRLRGEHAQADGWMARAHRLLATAPEGAEHGYPLYLEIAALMAVDLDAAVTLAQRMQELGRRFDDDTLVALGTYFEGRALCEAGPCPRGPRPARRGDARRPLRPPEAHVDGRHLLRAARRVPRARRPPACPGVDGRDPPLVRPAARRLPLSRVSAGCTRPSILHVHGAWDEAEAEAPGRVP